MQRVSAMLEFRDLPIAPRRPTREPPVTTAFIFITLPIFFFFTFGQFLLSLNFHFLIFNYEHIFGHCRCLNILIGLVFHRKSRCTSFCSCSDSEMQFSNASHLHCVGHMWPIQTCMSSALAIAVICCFDPMYTHLRRVQVTPAGKMAVGIARAAFPHPSSVFGFIPENPSYCSPLQSSKQKSDT